MNRLLPWLDRATELLLLALLAYLPLAFGGVLALSHMVLVAVAAAMAACHGLRCLCVPSASVVRNWVYVPVVLFLGLVGLQLIPLPQEALAVLSPRTAELWTGLLADVPAGREFTSSTLSLYPHATWGDFRLLLAGVVILFTVMHTAQRPSGIQLLLRGITIIGVVVVLLALVQWASGSARIYWAVQGGQRAAGPFVHPGHFSQFVNLCMGAGFAWWTVRAAARRPGRALSLGSSQGGTSLDRALLGFLVLGIVAIAFSMSRNGLASMVFAGAVTAAVMHKSGFMQGIGWPFVGLLFAGFVVLLIFGLDPIYERWVEIGDQEEASRRVRLELLRDAFGMAGAFPVFGIGHGAFAVVFPMFDRSTRAGTAEHAENQLLEQLVEVGAVGVLLLTAMVFLVFRAWVRLLRSRRSPIEAASFGLGFGLLAVGIHATTDFGLKIPAVGTLAAVCAASLLGMGSQRGSTRRSARAACAALYLALSAGLLGLLPGTIDAWKAEKLWRQAEELRDEMGVMPNLRGTEAQYERLVAKCALAAELQPRNVEYRTWAVLYRWMSAVAQEIDYDRSVGLHEVEHTPRLVAFAAETQKRLFEVLQVAPTDGFLWSAIGQLGVAWLDDPSAARWIHRGQDFAPHRPETNLAAGDQLLREGDDSGALDAFRRAIAVRAHPVAVIDMLVFELERPDLALEVAWDNLLWLDALERRLDSGPQDTALLTDVRMRTRQLVEDQAAGPDARPWVFARLADYALEDGDDEAAILHLHALLRRVPESPRRYELALVLSRVGRTEEARRQLRDLLGMHPTHGPGKALLVELGP